MTNELGKKTIILFKKQFIVKKKSSITISIIKKTCIIPFPYYLAFEPHFINDCALLMFKIFTIPGLFFLDFLFQAKTIFFFNMFV
jgi:hypothetical protein